MKTIDAKTKDLKALNSALKESVNGTPVKVKNAAHLHGLAAGLKHGEVIIEGDAGDYLGVLECWCDHPRDQERRQICRR